MTSTQTPTAPGKTSQASPRAAAQPLAEASPRPSGSVDDRINEMVQKAEESLVTCLHDCEDYVRQSPSKALLGALATGYLLRHVPIRSLIAANVRLLVSLAPPALLLYSAAKAYEMFRDQQGAAGEANG